jgi:hypothetical protein
MDRAAEKQWLEQWKTAGVALEAQWRDELRQLSAARALSAAEALLSLACELPTHRRSHSGLVEQQAHFRRVAPR